MELLYGTGLRLGEALSLSWRTLHAEGRRTLKVRGKGGKERLVVIGETVRVAMQKYEEKLPVAWRKEGGAALRTGFPTKPENVFSRGWFGCLVDSA